MQLEVAAPNVLTMETLKSVFKSKYRSIFLRQNWHQINISCKFLKISYSWVLFHATSMGIFLTIHSSLINIWESIDM